MIAQAEGNYRNSSRLNDTKVRNIVTIYIFCHIPQNSSYSESDVESSIVKSGEGGARTWHNKQQARLISLGNNWIYSCEYKIPESRVENDSPNVLCKFRIGILFLCCFSHTVESYRFFVSYGIVVGVTLKEFQWCKSSCRGNDQQYTHRMKE